MEGLSNLISTIAERAFYYAVVDLVFLGLLMLSHHWGYAVPDQVMQWINVAFVFCVSVVIVEGGRRLIEWIRGQREAAASEAQDADQAFRNIQALYADELRVLIALLADGAPRRLTVAPLSPMYPLLEKGVIASVRPAGGLAVIGEVHPAIWAQRVEMREHLSSLLQRAPAT